MKAQVAINDFLGQRRVAVVGLSRKPDDFSRYVFRELRNRHYDVVPVNPSGGEIDGQACFARVQDVLPAVDGALLMTSPEVTDEVVKDCAEAGVSRVWMHRGVGPGAVSEQATVFCREHGIEVVAGACPLMFLPEAGLAHRIHGAILKLFRRHPAGH